MKTVKQILLVLGVSLLLFIGGVLVRYYAFFPKSRPASTRIASKSSEVVERGKYLATHVAACFGCHSKVDDSKPGEPLIEGQLGSGRDFGKMPGFPGHLRSINLTPDAETGLGKWSDGEIVRAIREGVGRDEHTLFPMMPYKTYAESLTEDDAFAIVAYLRTLTPIHNDPGKTEINFPVSMFVRASPKPVETDIMKPPNDGVARGKWLLKAAACADCHDTFDNRRKPIEGKHFAGGTPFSVPGKGNVYASNLTSDKATGMGSYSDDDILRALNEGVGKSGRPLYVMPWTWYRGMTDADKKAMILALREIAPVANIVPAPNF